MQDGIGAVRLWGQVHGEDVEHAMLLLGGGCEQFEPKSVYCSHQGSRPPFVSLVGSGHANAPVGCNNLRRGDCTWTTPMRSVGSPSSLLETLSWTNYGTMVNIQLRSDCSDGHPSIQHANGTLPHDLIHLSHTVVWENSTFWCGLLLSVAQGLCEHCSLLANKVGIHHTVNKMLKCVSCTHILDINRWKL